jgi:hypothetical protein
LQRLANRVQHKCSDFSEICTRWFRIQEHRSIYGPIPPPNGKYVGAIDDSLVSPLTTGDPIIPPKNTLDRSVGRDDFLRTYSPGETLAAVVRLEETTAVILDLESGDPRLVIVGMEISYLRATGSHDCRRWLCLLGMCPQVSLRSARSGASPPSGPYPGGQSSRRANHATPSWSP